MARRLNRQLGIIQTVVGHVARFTICSHRYVQTRQIRQDMENFIFAEATQHGFENQSNQGFTAEVMQRLDGVLREVNSFLEA
jgi:hypothetical protein